MKLMWLDPKSIKVPEIRVTAQFDDELLAQFKDSLDAIGQIAPIIVYQVGEDHVLCDGKHRLDEALAKGSTKIQAVVIPGDMVDVLTRNIVVDQLRGKTSVTEMVKVIKVLSQDYGLDPDQIASKTYKNRDYVEKLIKIAQASPVVLEAVDRGVIGIGIAYELSRLPHPIQQEEVIAKHQVYNYSVKDVKDLVEQTLEFMRAPEEKLPPATLGKPPAPRVYKCEGCKNDTDPRYLRPVMLCPDCFGVVWKLAQASPPEPEGNGE